MTTQFAFSRATQDANAAPARLLRVCHVSMCLRTGGLERLLVELARFHDRERIEPHFVALAELGPPADDLREAGRRVDSMRFGDVGKLRLIKRLRDDFVRNQIDIVHTHNTYAQFYASLAAKWAGVKACVNTQHGRGCGPNRRAVMQFKIGNRFTDRIVGVSQDALALCLQQDKASAHKMVCLWNGIDLNRFAFHGPAETGPAISVARLSPEKDFSTLLRAVRLVVDESPDFQLRLVGDGQERGLLEALTDELRLREHVAFLGERQDVPEQLRQASFFVSSSRTEGVSLTLLEAMAVGLPVVTTSVGGNPEVVEQERTGLLVPSQAPDRLAQAILRMHRDAELRSEMAQLARARVEANFDIRRMVSAYESLYEQILSGTSAGEDADRQHQ